MFDFEDKTVIITGASRGIGLGAFMAFAKANAYVIGTATSKVGVDNLNKIISDNSFNGKAYQLDVTSDDSIKKFAEHVGSLTGKIVLVNNAGINGSGNILLRENDTDWENVINVNLNSIYKVTKPLIKPMLKAKWGRIINISSLYAHTGNSGSSGYSAAKAGVIAISKSLAHEIGSRNITVNTVAPGYIETDMTIGITGERKAAFLARIPVARLGKTEDIAAGLMYLASDQASYVTGETLNINGGIYMA